MKKLFFPFLAFTLFSCEPITTPKKEFLSVEIFKNPTTEYRSLPFYSLNDKLDTAEISRQLNEFKKGGFGGTFLHSRTGLLTEYLGQDWWDAMDAGVRTSEELGIKAWFYDEDKWPSGFAGGKIPRANEEFHAHTLFRIKKSDKLPSKASVLYEDSNYRYIDMKMEMGSPWFNGTCWVDLLNPATVKAFMDTTYRPYAERYKDKIGKSAMGMFTDEPQIGPMAAVPGAEESFIHEGKISFSPVIVARFKEMHGYDLIANIPLLFENKSNYRKVRIDYFRTITNCFENSFSKQLGDYCKQNNFIFTGHYMGEETPTSVTHFIGNAMVHYRHMQAPGIDHLGLRIDGGLNAAKSLTSVANQYGIKWRLSELFGTSGQNMSFEDRKWILDWHTLNGVNMMCPHLSLYSMKGERKRDYPPTISPQQPYWKYNSFFEDYSARLCYATSIGKFAADVLVIHPIESSYMEYAAANFQWNTPIDNKFLDLLNEMMKINRDYDLGDEQIISEIAAIEKGQFKIGEMRYALVLLPEMMTIRQSTVSLLNEFYQQGGKIAAINTLPTYFDGEENDSLANLLQSICQIVSMDGLKKNLTKILKPAYEIKGVKSKNIWSHHRIVPGGHVFQLTNTSRLLSTQVKIEFNFAGKQVILWDPSTGENFLMKEEDLDQYVINFAPAQTWIITSGYASKDANPQEFYNIPLTENNILTLENGWKGKRIHPNVITLDFAQYSINNGKSYSNNEPIIGIHERFTEKKFNGPLELVYPVEIESIPKVCELVVEQPELYKIKINGKPYVWQDNGFYIDHSFRKSNIAALLQKGVNKISLSIDYKAPLLKSFDAYERYGSEIESIYLIGDFAVKANTSNDPITKIQINESGVLPEISVNRLTHFTICDELAIVAGNIVTNGYPFYSGEIEYSNTFEFTPRRGKNYLLTFPTNTFTVAKLKLNGKELPILAFSPWQIDISNELTKGKNTIEITLTNTLRNLLGPHHNNNAELSMVGPITFTGATSWTGSAKGEVNWYDVRINGKPGIWSDDYFMIPFGLISYPVIKEVSY